MSDNPLIVNEPRSRVFRGEHTTPVVGIAMHLASNRLVSIGHEGEVVFWDLKTGGRFSKTCCPHALGRAVAISPDGGYIAVASQSPRVLLWGPDEHQMDVEPLGLVGHETAVRYVAFHPTHGFLVSCGGDDKTMMTWNVKTGKRIATYTFPHCLRAIAFHPFQNLAVVSMSEGQDSGRGFVATITFTKEGDVLEVSKPVQVHHWWIESIAFSHDGQFIVVGGSSGALKRLSFPELHVLNTIDLPAHFSDAIALSADSRILVVGGDKDLIYFFNTKTGEMISVLGTFHGNIESFCVSSDARYLAVNGSRFGSPMSMDALQDLRGVPFLPEQAQWISEQNRDGVLSPSILDFGSPNFGNGPEPTFIQELPV